MEKQTIRIHRVGSLTFGIVLIVSGILFLLQLFFPSLDYEIIRHFWPLILIMLGVEVLLGSAKKNFEIRGENGQILEENRVVYDGVAIILTAVLTIFTMLMGLIDWTYRNTGIYW